LRIRKIKLQSLRYKYIGFRSSTSTDKHSRHVEIFKSKYDKHVDFLNIPSLTKAYEEIVSYNAYIISKYKALKRTFKNSSIVVESLQKRQYCFKKSCWEKLWAFTSK